MLLRELITNHTVLKPSKQGWHNLKCPVCSDYKVRAGFNFDDNKVFYNCWNCGHQAYYDEGGRSVSLKMRQVLNALGASDDDINKNLALNFFNKPTLENLDSSTDDHTNCSFKIADLPPNSYKLTDVSPDDVWAIVAGEYLESRGLSTTEYEWYLSSDPKYEARLIIPFFRYGKIIYWQARAFDSDAKDRYLNPLVPRNAIMFGLNYLETYSDKPLFVVEGVFDAINIEGVSLLGSTVSECKEKALNSTQRKKVFVIDKDQNGYKLGDIAIKKGWSISFIEGNIKDVNEAVQKYGKLWTMSNIMKNIKSGFEAQVHIETLRRNVNG